MNGLKWEVVFQDLTTGEHTVVIFDLELALAWGGANQKLEFSPDGQRPRVLRRVDRHHLTFGSLARKALLTPTPFESVEVLAAEFDPGGSTGDEAYRHGDSEELFIVISGAVELQLGDERFDLGPGDCAHYRSSMLHRVANPGRERAEVVFVISPPSY